MTMTSLRQRLAMRRLELIAHSAQLRQQMAGDTAGLRQRLAVGRRVLTLMPLLVRPLLARLWRRARGR